MNANHLAEAPSPYLQQHASNPVDWYPWSEEALHKARIENKPILLSIGYAACHWCHVMAHESFEDPETAALMNELFINIKVDREERPDLDKIYQAAHQLLTQQGGGWPLTIFLSPHDLTPFISGTYFPKEPRYHLPAFKEVLRAVANIYHNRLDDINQQNASLQHILQFQPESSIDTLDNQPIQQAVIRLEKNYDKKFGGFGHAPKFAQPSKLNFLFSYRPELTLHTLTALANGGIQDQLSGGFFRYSVDEKWLIPHFEKMLYDNAQLLSLYIAATTLNDNPLFKETAKQTADWLLTTLLAKNNGFYSSIDADIEGHEGKYYVWDKEEIKKILTAEEFAFVQNYFGLNHNPNFENTWHLFIAENKKLSSQEKQLFASAKNKLLAARNKRSSPPLDTKILTAWNALTASALLKAGAVLGNEKYIEAGKNTLQLLKTKLYQDKQLYACLVDDKAYQTAYLDDYVFLIDALLTSLQIDWQTDNLQLAIELTESVLKNFSDAAGGFYFTGKDVPTVIYRPKTMIDEVIPPGNSIAIKILLQLGYLTNNTNYLTAAEKTLKAAGPALTNYPLEHCSILTNLALYLQPATMIIIRGDKNKAEAWQKTCHEKYPNANIYIIPENETALPKHLAEKTTKDKITAYVCKGTTCLEPVISLDELLNVLHDAK